MRDLWNNLPDETVREMESVRNSLTQKPKGGIVQSKQNCVTALMKDPLLKGAVCFNRWTQRIDIVRNLGWRRDSPAFTDVDLSHLDLYLEQFYDQRIEKNILAALDVVAESNAYHPIRDYLESIQWDGQERMRLALHHFLGAGTDDLTCACLRVFMLGALERIYHPGSKYEIMLCLIGEQGVGKSSFFRYLALKDEWFSDDLKHLDDENVHRKMQGHWIIEMAEMLGTASAKSVEEIKAFLSRQSETYKVPYDRFARDYLRQCVFVGTTNKQHFLPLDRTGNRRFYPVQTDITQAETHVLTDVAATREYMRQLWAEALMLYRSGNWSFSLDCEMEHQLDIYRSNFMAEDTSTGMIQAWLDQYRGDFVCTKMLFNEAYHLYGEPDRKTIGEINDIMNNTIDGWVPGPQHRFPVYGQQRSWTRNGCGAPGSDEAAFTELADTQQAGIPPEWLE